MNLLWSRYIKSKTICLMIKLVVMLIKHLPPPSPLNLFPYINFLKYTYIYHILKGTMLVKLTTLLVGLLWML